MEEHDCGFKEAFICLEGGFPFVTFFNLYIVISSSNVQFCEPLCTFQLVDKVADEGEGVGVLSHSFIQQPIVLAGSECIGILFSDKEEW